MPPDNDYLARSAGQGLILLQFLLLFFSLCQHVSISDTLCPIVLILSYVTQIFELISLRSLYMYMSWDLRSPRDHLGSQQKRARFMSFQRNNGSSWLYIVRNYLLIDRNLMYCCMVSNPCCSLSKDELSGYAEHFQF